MRRIVLAAASLELLAWIGVTLWAARQPQAIDLSGIHGIGLALILPALALGVMGRWLRFALALVCAAGFMYLAVLAGSQLAS